MQNNDEKFENTLPSYVVQEKNRTEFLLNYLNEHADTTKCSRLWRLVEWIILFICGGLFTCAFPPFNFWIVGFFGVVPLVLYTVKAPPIRAMFNGYVWGFGWAISSFYWFYEIAIPFPFVAAVILAIFPAVWSLMISFTYPHLMVNNRTRSAGYDAIRIALLNVSSYKEAFFAFYAALVWVSLEWIRSWIATGLPWNTLATTQWENLQLIQIAEYTGFYGVSFAVAIANVAIAFALKNLYHYFKVGIKIHLTPCVLAGIVIMLTITIPSGNMQKHAKEIRNPLSDTKTFNVGLVQTKNPIYWGGSSNDYAKIYNKLCNYSTHLAVNHHSDVIIWPETVIPLHLSLTPNYLRALAQLIHEIKTPMIIGAPDVQKRDSGNAVLNAAFLLNTEGKVADFYAKKHLVAFGEFIPFGGILDKIFPNLRTQFSLPEDLTPGANFNPLEPKQGLRLGVNICFEDIMPYVSREFIRNGANVLCTITNDGWYPQSAERAQHFANAIFRAVENRCYFVRTGNYAQAVLIDPLGRVVDFLKNRPAQTFDPMSAEDGILNVTIPIPREQKLSFYTRYGDVFAWGCFALSCLGLILALFAWIDFKKCVMTQKNSLEHEPVQGEKV